MFTNVTIVFICDAISTPSLSDEEEEEEDQRVQSPVIGVVDDTELVIDEGIIHQDLIPSTCSEKSITDNKQTSEGISHALKYSF